MFNQKDLRKLFTAASVAIFSAGSTPVQATELNPFATDIENQNNIGDKPAASKNNQNGKADTQSQDASEFFDKFVKTLPHSVYLTGEITNKTAQEAIEELNDIIQYTDKEKPISLVINSNGGSVIAGEELLDKINDLLDQGHNIQLVCDARAESMAAHMLISFKGQRLATKNCTVTTHAPYFKTLFKTSDGKTYWQNQKINDATLSEEQFETLKNDRHHFAKSLQERSECYIGLTPAYNYFTAKDRSIPLKELLNYGMIDHVVTKTTDGGYKIDHSFDRYKNKCTPKWGQVEVTNDIPLPQKKPEEPVQP